MTQSEINMIERKVSEFRQKTGLSDAEAVNLKSLLIKLNILTVFRPLSSNFSGMSLRNPKGENRFMLINSNQPIGRQHFTIAHELYHLYIEDSPKPHNCDYCCTKSKSEQYADAFAQHFLMPYAGILQIIPDNEIKSAKVSLATIIRLEQYFSVSRSAIVNRLKDLGFISKADRETFLNLSAIKTAREYGYNTDLYNPGNENLVIGDFGEKARRLYDSEKISEGHYLELLCKIGINGYED